MLMRDRTRLNTMVGPVRGAGCEESSPHPCPDTLQRPPQGWSGWGLPGLLLAARVPVTSSRFAY